VHLCESGLSNWFANNADNASNDNSSVPYTYDTKKLVRHHQEERRVW